MCQLEGGATINPWRRRDKDGDAPARLVPAVRTNQPPSKYQPVLKFEGSFMITPLSNS